MVTRPKWRSLFMMLCLQADAISDAKPSHSSTSGRPRHSAARPAHRRQGQANSGVYQFNVPRRDPILEGGMQIAPVGPMGVAIAINFQPTGGGKAS